MNDLQEGTFPAGQCVCGGEGHILPSYQLPISDAQAKPQICIHLRSSEKGNHIFSANPMDGLSRYNLELKV